MAVGGNGRFSVGLSRRFAAMPIMRYALLGGFTVFAGASLAAEGIEWRHRAAHGAVVLTANPLTTAQRTAFFVARGFPGAAIRPYALACGYSFSMRNTGSKPVRSMLADWRAIGAGAKAVRLRLPSAWDADWVQANVSETARIAFRWAQFQAENSLEAGDWIMGMATLESLLTGHFRLVAVYHDDTGPHEITVEALACLND